MKSVAQVVATVLLEDEEPDINDFMRQQGISREADVSNRHCGPYDRGSADKYYGRSFNPHFFRLVPGNPMARGTLVPKEQMLPVEIEAYTKGYNEQTDLKDWGGEEP